MQIFRGTTLFSRMYPRHSKAVTGLPDEIYLISISHLPSYLRMQPHKRPLSTPKRSLSLFNDPHSTPLDHRFDYPSIFYKDSTSMFALSS